MKNAYSVWQVNHYIKNMFDQDFMLKRISVKGEVSNCKYHSSGHIYFSLKDEHAAITCVMFAGNRSGLKFELKDGQNVIVQGSVSVFERDGRYQLYANEITLDGAGLLFEKFEALKKELEEMGMFAPQYKQAIPEYAQKIGIVTAPTGAAIRDIQNIAGRRNPYVQLILYPALVQGDGAAASIVHGIETLDALGVDVIIVGRGGGSMEDLWAFNEESVARAIFACKTPVISAVGHETDFTIADFVADLRAPTPSAAAELAVADVSQIFEQLEAARAQLKRLMETQISQATEKCGYLKKQLELLSPESRIREQRQILIGKEERMQALMQAALEEAKHQLQIMIEKYKGLSPLDKLQQGYSSTQNEAGKTVAKIEQVKVGERIKVYVSDGLILAKVEEKEALKHA